MPCSALRLNLRHRLDKGSRGPEHWEPPDQSYWCEYAIHWINIKVDWNLTATGAELAALKQMLNTCDPNAGIGVVQPSKESTTPASATPTPEPKATAVPPTATRPAPAPTATAAPTTPTPTVEPTATAIPATPAPALLLCQRTIYHFLEQFQTDRTETAQTSTLGDRPRISTWLPAGRKLTGTA